MCLMEKILKIAGLLGLTLTGIVYLAIFQNLFLYNPNYVAGGGAQVQEIMFGLFTGCAGAFCIWYGFKQISDPRPVLSLFALAFSVFIVVSMAMLSNTFHQMEGGSNSVVGLTMLSLSPLAIMSSMPLARYWIDQRAVNS